MADDVTGARIGLGCVKLGSMAGGGERSGLRLVHQAYDLGVRVFDTADAYGSGASERVLGRALRGRREHVVIATKGGYRFAERGAAELAARRLAAPVARRLRSRSGGGGGGGDGGGGATAAGRSYTDKDFSVAYLRGAVTASLRRLGTDHIDLYQLHGAPVAVATDELRSLMSQLVAGGTIGGFGVALESLDDAAAWLEVPGLASVQLPFGILDPEAGAHLVDDAAGRGVRVIARGIFAAGLLEADDATAERQLRPAQIPLRARLRDAAAHHGVAPLALAAWYVTGRPGIDTALIGMSSSTHLRANLAHLGAARPPDGLVDEVRAALQDYASAVATGRGAP